MFEQAQIQEFKEVRAAQLIFVTYNLAEDDVRIVEKLCELCMFAHHVEHYELIVFCLYNTQHHTHTLFVPLHALSFHCSSL